MNPQTTPATAAGTDLVETPKKGRALARRLSERGMATAEYAVGILAAVALALMLMKVFQGDSFMTLLVKLITTIFTKVLGWLP